MNSNLRQFTYQNVPLDQLVPYHDRNYSFVEAKIVFWVALLTDPLNWYGHIIARPLPNGKFEMLTGHHRYEALRRLGWSTIPVAIAEYTDAEAHAVYVTDNNLQFAPTAGMAIGSTPGAIRLYRTSGMPESQAKDEVCKNLGLSNVNQVTSLVEMAEALADGTLAGEIRDVLDIAAAIAFWRSMKNWAKDFGEFPSAEKQALFISSADAKDIRRDLPRVISDARKAIEQAIVPAPRLSQPKPSLEVRLRALSNSMRLIIQEVNNLPDDVDIHNDTLATLRTQCERLQQSIRVEVIE